MWREIKKEEDRNNEGKKQRRKGIWLISNRRREKRLRILGARK